MTGRREPSELTIVVTPERRHILACELKKLDTIGS